MWTVRLYALANLGVTQKRINSIKFQSDMLHSIQA